MIVKITFLQHVGRHISHYYWRLGGLGTRVHTLKNVQKRFQNHHWVLILDMKDPCQPCLHTYTTGKAKGGPAIPSGMKDGERQTRLQVVETLLCHLTWAHHDKDLSGRNSPSQDETSLAVTLTPPACSSLHFPAHLAT